MNSGIFLIFFIPLILGNQYAELSQSQALYEQVQTLDWNAFTNLVQNNFQLQSELQNQPQTSQGEQITSKYTQKTAFEDVQALLNEEKFNLMKLYLTNTVEYHQTYVELVSLLAAQLTHAELQYVYQTLKSYEIEAEKNRQSFNQYILFAPSLKVSATSVLNNPKLNYLMYKNHILQKTSNDTFINYLINQQLVEAEDEFVWKKFFDTYFYPGTLNNLFQTNKIQYEQQKVVFYEKFLMIYGDYLAEKLLQLILQHETTQVSGQQTQAQQLTRDERFRYRNLMRTDLDAYLTEKRALLWYEPAKYRDLLPQLEALEKNTLGKIVHLPPRFTRQEYNEIVNIYFKLPQQEYVAWREQLVIYVNQVPDQSWILVELEKLEKQFLGEIPVVQLWSAVNLLKQSSQAQERSKATLNLVNLAKAATLFEDVQALLEKNKNDLMDLFLSDSLTYRQVYFDFVAISTTFLTKTELQSVLQILKQYESEAENLRNKYLEFQAFSPKLKASALKVMNNPNLNYFKFKYTIIQQLSNQTFVKWLAEKSLNSTETQFIQNIFFDAYYYPGELNYLIVVDVALYQAQKNTFLENFNINHGQYLTTLINQTIEDHEVKMGIIQAKEEIWEFNVEKKLELRQLMKQDLDLYITKKRKLLKTDPVRYQQILPNLEKLEVATLGYLVQLPQKFTNAEYKYLVIEWFSRPAEEYAVFKQKVVNYVATALDQEWMIQELELLEIKFYGHVVILPEPQEATTTSQNAEQTEQQQVQLLGKQVSAKNDSQGFSFYGIIALLSLVVVGFIFFKFQSQKNSVLKISKLFKRKQGRYEQPLL